MKRLFAFVVAVSLMLAVGVGLWAASDLDRGTPPLSASLSPVVQWSANSWIFLYIPDADMTVDLGVTDDSLYDPVTDTWKPLTSGTKNVYVSGNISFSLRVTAASTTADLARFEITGGDLGGFVSLDTKRTLKSGGSGMTHIDDIQYQYVPSWDDAPGNYSVTVTYTVTAP